MVVTVKSDDDCDESSTSTRTMRATKVRSMEKLAAAITNMNNYQSDEKLEKMRFHSQEKEEQRNCRKKVPSVWRFAKACNSLQALSKNML